MAMEGDKEKILSHGFTVYIAKPINTRKVRTLLEEYKNNLL
jgi:CheY-like chemotaxis protein